MALRSPSTAGDTRNFGLDLAAAAPITSRVTRMNSSGTTISRCFGLVLAVVVVVVSVT
jgi:hypothetical protein